MSTLDQRIRQVVFLVENKIYKFDVNSQTTLKNLRKIIIAAANISNKVFKFFHNNKEIVAADSTTLNQLFSQEETIEIHISSLKQKSSDLSPICLKQGLSCETHMFKFPYLYCYDCAKSICSMCVKSDLHRDHNLIDKHDYLQNSEVLVSSIFKDMSMILSDLSLDRRNLIESIRTKISTILIPNLIDQIKSIEIKLVEIISSFILQVDKNKDVLYSNVELLKNSCADGLEELKYQLKIQDIMIDENIFIIIDEKIKQIAKEKNKIIGDQKKYEDLVNGSNMIIGAIDVFCHEITDLIDKKLKIFLEENFKNKILSNVVPNISKEEIYQLLFSDIKKLSKSPSRPNLTAYSCEKFKLNSSDKKKAVQESNLNLNLLPTFDLSKNGLNSTEDTKPSDRNILDHVFGLPQDRIMDIEKHKFQLEGTQTKNIDKTDDTVHKEKELSEALKNDSKNVAKKSISESSITEIKDIEKKQSEEIVQRSSEERVILIDESKALRITQEETGAEKDFNEEPNISIEQLNVDMEQDEKFIKEALPQKHKEKRKTNDFNDKNFDPNFSDKIIKEIQKGRDDGNVLEKAEKENVIINLIPDSDQLYVFQEKSTNQIMKKKILFPKILNTKVFPIYSAFSNYNNKTYISGGLIDNQECKLFFLYDFTNDKILRLSDMNVPRSSHSSMIHDNYLYVVGGNKNKSIERYSFKELVWTKLGDMLEEKKTPIVIIQKDLMYIFSGVNMEGKYLKTIERINVNIPYSKAELVQVSNEENINIGIIGCGIIRHRPDEVLLLGGEYENLTKSNSGFFLNFEDNSIRGAEIELEEGLFFQENALQEIGKERFGNFNYDDQFFQIDI